MIKLSKEKIEKIVNQVKAKLASNPKIDPKLEKALGEAVKKFGPALVEEVKDEKNVNSKKGAAEVVEFANHVFHHILPTLRAIGLTEMGSSPIDVAQTIAGYLLAGTAVNYQWKAMFGRDFNADGLKAVIQGRTFINHMTDLVKSVLPSSGEKSKVPTKPAPKALPTKPAPAVK